MTLSQIASELLLEWKAPAHNQDGTDENLDLREVRVLRRILDFAALREAQAQTMEATETGPPPEIPTEPAEATQEETAEAQATETPATETEDAEDAEAPATGAQATEAPAPRPLVIPPFAIEAQLVSSLESLVGGEDFVYREPIDPLWLGKRVEYAVVYANRRKIESPLSTIVQIDPVRELAAPVSLTAEAGDGFVSLKWNAPEGLPAEDVGFAVLRRPADDEIYPDSPLTPELILAHEFEDRTAVFGKATCYVVSTVLVPVLPEVPEVDEESPEDPPENVEDELELEEAVPDAPPKPLVPPITSPSRVESRPSHEACLTPEDVFPPKVPEDLVGVPTGGGILLTWRAVEGTDVSGYRVYRSSSADGDFELLAEATRASYSDATADVGIRYFYFVTAFDRAPEPNESARSETMEAIRRE